MKKNIFFTLAITALAVNVFAANFGAIAVDRTDGFVYGYSMDQPSIEQARARALDECSKQGGDCDVELELSGDNRCGSYRTIDSSAGSAYGWGKAANRKIAGEKARAECEKHANGHSCSNHVWACNSEEDSHETAPEESTDIDRNAIGQAVTYHYDNEGQWAGKFRIGEIVQMRIEGSGSTIYAHVKYKYLPLPGNERSSGFDQRIFTINIDNGSYDVIHMDDYMSGRF